MNTEEIDKNWKLKLRYGKLTTPYSHYSAIAEGVAENLNEEFSCPSGSAFMSMKMWAESTEQAIDMMAVIGGRIGFQVTDRTYVYDTESESPPKDKPYGYSINFSPFQ